MQPACHSIGLSRWSETIYANGQKIAKVQTQMPLLHWHMDRASTGCGMTVVVGVNLLNVPIAAGDRFTMSVATSGAVQWGAGFIQTNGTGMDLLDQNGAYAEPLTRRLQQIFYRL